MKFEVELLTKNISITKLDELFLGSEIISRVLKLIQGISDTIGHLDLPNTLNDPNSEEDDE